MGEMTNRSVDNYSEQWREYRWRFRIFIIACALYFPGVLIAGFLISKLTSLTSWHAGLIAFIVFGGACALSGSYLIYWRCPRCHSQYCWKFGVNWPFARRRLHCGLPRYARAHGFSEASER